MYWGWYYNANIFLVWFLKLIPIPENIMLFGNFFHFHTWMIDEVRVCAELEQYGKVQQFQANEFNAKFSNLDMSRYLRYLQSLSSFYKCKITVKLDELIWFEYLRKFSWISISTQIESWFVNYCHQFRVIGLSIQ